MRDGKYASHVYNNRRCKFYRMRAFSSDCLFNPLENIHNLLLADGVYFSAIRLILQKVNGYDYVYPMVCLSKHHVDYATI